MNQTFYTSVQVTESTPTANSYRKAQGHNVSVAMREIRKEGEPGSSPGLFTYFSLTHFENQRCRRHN